MTWHLAFALLFGAYCIRLLAVNARLHRELARRRQFVYPFSHVSPLHDPRHPSRAPRSLPR